jgi:4-hydroxybenzoate polyprenyltransferase
MSTSVRKNVELVHSYIALRRAVGWIALALPVVLIRIHRGKPLTSISQSYYRDFDALFVGFLCAIGVFLLFYRGYDGRDRATSLIAGVCAILLAKCPVELNNDV